MRQSGELETVGGLPYLTQLTTDLPTAVEATGPATLLTSGGGGETVCLVAVRPEGVNAFGRTIRELAEAGTVTRVEAEPHL